MSALESYRGALATCPKSGGGVHAWMLGVANYAAAAGVPSDVCEREIMAAMTRPPSPASEVRDTVSRAFRESGARIGNHAPLPPRKPKPIPAPRAADRFIRLGAGVSGMDYLEASPVHLLYGDEWWKDAVVLFRALFLPDEYVFACDTQQAAGVMGRTVRTRKEWEKEFYKRSKVGAPLPLLFMANPVSPIPAKTKDGKMSLRCDASITAFRHAVAEMDGMPLEKQFEFWWGWGLKKAASVTFSGNHSLHVLLRVDEITHNAEEWEKNVKGKLFDRILIPFGCDPQCRNPGRLTRLAGAIRVPAAEDKWLGCPHSEIPPPMVQKLWYVREELQA